MKTPPASTAVLVATVALTLAAITLVAADALRTGSSARAREFQRLVRGLGMGPKLTLSRCPDAFDPRPYPNWRAHPPVVCGEYFCPHHAGSVFDLAAEGAADTSDWEAATDAEGR